MNLFNFLLLATLAVLSLATDFGIQRTDMFEDLGDSVLPGKPFITDGGITYKGVSLIGGSLLPQVAGVRAHSPTHKIVASPSQGSFITTGRCLQLKRIWFGCRSVDVLIGGVASAAFPCVLTMTSFDNTGKQTGVQKFTFETTDLVLSDMVTITSTLPPASVVRFNATGLPFKDVDQVGKVTVALEMDDISYIQYGNTKMGKKACGF